MVQTPSNQIGHPEKDVRRVGAVATASEMTIPTIPLVEYKALKRQSEENHKALGEMATLLQQFLCQEQLPLVLHAYAQSAQSGGVLERRDALQQTHRLPYVPKHRNLLPR